MAASPTNTTCGFTRNPRSFHRQLIRNRQSWPNDSSCGSSELGPLPRQSTLLGLCRRFARAVQVSIRPRVSGRDSTPQSRLLPILSRQVGIFQFWATGGRGGLSGILAANASWVRRTDSLPAAGTWGWAVAPVAAMANSRARLHGSMECMPGTCSRIRHGTSVKPRQGPTSVRRPAVAASAATAPDGCTPYDPPILATDAIGSREAASPGSDGKSTSQCSAHRAANAEGVATVQPRDSNCCCRSPARRMSRVSQSSRRSGRSERASAKASSTSASSAAGTSRAAAIGT